MSKITIHRKEFSMNQEKPYRDQAERLRQKIDKLNVPSAQESSLPPRSDLHRNKKKKTKLKFKYPLIRLLVLFFILLPITIFSIYSYMGGKYPWVVKTTVTSNKGYETVNFEDTNNNKEKLKPKNPHSKEKN